MISTGSFLTGTDATKEQDTLAGKFAAIWEKKNAKAARAGGVSLMALTLAACGSSSDDTAADAGAATDAATDEAATDTTTAVLTALQASAADILSASAASDAGVEAATIAAGAAARVMTANELTTAPATAAAADTAVDTLYAAVENEMSVAVGNTGDGLDASDALIAYGTTLGAATLDALVATLTATTAAEKTARTELLADLNTALAYEASADAAALVGLANLAAAAAVATDDENAVFAASAAVAATIGGNLYADTVNTDTSNLTAAETAAGQLAFATMLNSVLLANSTGYADEWADLTGAERQAILEAMVADTGVGGTMTFLTADANSGAPTAVSDMAAALTAAATVANADANIATTVANMTSTGTVDTTAAAMDNHFQAAVDAGFDAAVIADFNIILAAAQAIADAAEGGNIADIQAGLVATESLGAESVDTDGGAATNGDDVFIFSEAGGNMTVGTAATATAPGNVLGGAGSDSIVILGEYAASQFVTITETQNDTIATTALGDASVLEIFVYQDATTGNAILHVEENAFDGSDTTNAALTTLTITDVAFADLTQVVGDGVTVLNAAEAVVA